MTLGRARAAARRQGGRIVPELTNRAVGGHCGLTAAWSEVLHSRKGGHRKVSFAPLLERARGLARAAGLDACRSPVRE
jgi:hypothetical protein